jgi:hypothetical protein
MMERLLQVMMERLLQAVELVSMRTLTACTDLSHDLSALLMTRRTPSIS